MKTIKEFVLQYPKVSNPKDSHNVFDRLFPSTNINPDDVVSIQYRTNKNFAHWLIFYKCEV